MHLLKLQTFNLCTLCPYGHITTTTTNNTNHHAGSHLKSITLRSTLVYIYNQATDATFRKPIVCQAKLLFYDLFHVHCAILLHLSLNLQYFKLAMFAYIHNSILLGNGLLDLELYAHNIITYLLSM